MRVAAPEACARRTGANAAESAIQVAIDADFNLNVRIALLLIRGQYTHKSTEIHG
jgi:hypothetical protein